MTNLKLLLVVIDGRNIAHIPVTCGHLDLLQLKKYKLLWKAVQL
jgi:hypothetical protein